MPVFNTLQGPAVPPLTAEEIKRWLKSHDEKISEEYDYAFDGTVQGEGWTLDDYDQRTD